MSTTRIFEGLTTNMRTIRIAMLPSLFLLVVAVVLLVYATGGVRYAYVHAMYMPILLASFVFGVRGGLLVGLLCGLAIGPFTPISTTTGEMQDTLNWLYRTAFFMLVGLTSGLFSDCVRSYLRHLKWIMRHDIATQLPNRVALLDALATLQKEDQATSPHLLIVLRLENAMELKSAFGFEIIEELMRQSAQRYEEVLHGQARAYRIDTEQIGILIRNSKDQTIPALLGTLISSTHQPFKFNDIPVHIDARLGYVTFDALVHAPGVYLQQAEAALVVAHESDQDSTLYSPQITSLAKDNLSILGCLMDSMDAGQLSMHYQPKICMRTGTVKSVEALMRWQHPERGNIPPGIFIPRAEQSTLINVITEFALKQAMQQIVVWRSEGIEIPIAVNISPRNLLQPGFVEMILDLLQEYGVDGSLLELEVTEGALMTDMARTIIELHRLAEAKITISIDDFGTGYSSLQYLHKLPISLIKIDQSFVRRLPDDKGALHIVEAAVTLTHNMGMQTIAEGVETAEIYQVLGELGCDIAQGFVISHPLPAAAFTAWHRSHSGQFSLNARPH